MTERSFWRRQWDWIIGRAGRRSVADLYFGPGGMLSWLAEQDDDDDVRLMTLAPEGSLQVQGREGQLMGSNRRLKASSAVRLLVASEPPHMPSAY